MHRQRDSKLNLLLKVPWCLIAAIFILSVATAAFAQSGDELIQLKTAAEAGDPAAQTKMAERDSAHAELWYRKAAAQGYAPAEGKLGEMLNMRTSMIVNLKPEARNAVGQEALKWMGLAASQGDKLGQATLAQVCYDGRLVKQDLVAAYQWSELALQGGFFSTAAITAQSVRDRAILKMTADQLAEGKHRVAEFKPRVAANTAGLVPAWVSSLKLTGISGDGDKRIATINNQTFAAGETDTVELGAQTVTIHCEAITSTNATITIAGLSTPQVLTLVEK